MYRAGRLARGGREGGCITFRADPMTIYIAIVAENERKERSLRVSNRFSLGVENEQANNAGRNETEPFSRDQILRRERGRGHGINLFSLFLLLR